MKKILVTGGAGFIGSKVCHKLSDLGHKVIALDISRRRYMAIILRVSSIMQILTMQSNLSMIV